MDNPVRFAAFISYNRKADYRLATLIQRSLHQFAKPWYRLRSLRVFRDDSNLAANPGLWPSVQQGLDASEFLILLASPNAAESEWVTREVQYWLDHKPRDRILLVLTAGEIAWDAEAGDFDWTRTTSLPPNLRGVFLEEPRYVDLRDFRDANSSGVRRLMPGLIADLAAPLHQRPKDELISEDLRVFRRNRILAAGAAAIVTVLAIVATLFAVESNHQADEARHQRDMATASRDLAIFNQVAAQADRVRGLDVSLAAQLDLIAYRMRPTEQVQSRLLNSQHSALSLPLKGHTGLVVAVAIHPDGRRIASADYNGMIHLWTPNRMSEPYKARNEDSIPVGHAAFSPDGRILATGDARGIVTLWQVDDGGSLKQLARASADLGPIADLVFSPDGQSLAVGTMGGHVAVWNPRKLDGANFVTSWQVDTESLESLAYRPDSRVLATGHENAMVKLWNTTDPRNPQPIGQVLSGHADSVRSVAFTPDGNTLATGSDDHTVRLWNVSDPENVTIRSIINADASQVNTVAIARDGRTLAVGGSDPKIRLWNITAPDNPVSLGAPLAGHTNVVNRIAFSIDARTLVSSSIDGTLRVWNLSSTSLLGHSGPVADVAFSPDGKTLASGSGDGTVQLWNTEHPHNFASLGTALTGHQGVVYAVRFQPGGRLLASAGHDGSVRLWDVSDRARPVLGATLPAEDAMIVTIAFSPDGRLLASGTFDGVVQLWNVSDSARPVKLHARTDTQDSDLVPVYSMDFSPDGKVLAAAYGDGTIKLWNVSHPARPVQIGNDISGHVGRGAFGAVTAVAFTADGAQLLSGSGDTTLQMWDTADLSRVAPLGSPSQGHIRYISRVVVWPDGNMAVTASGDHTIRRWRLRGSDPLIAIGEPFTPHTDIIGGLALSPDGTFLATGGADHLVRLHDNRIESAIQRICATTADITRDEWNTFVSPDLPFRPPCLTP